MNINTVVISGTIEEEKFSHISFGLKFREMILSIKRVSNVKDFVKVIYPEGTSKFANKQRVKISGKIRSRREEKKLQIYVFADSIELYNGPDTNEMVLEGYVCSDPFYKEKGNREITQFLICSADIRKVYASAIIWKKTDVKIGDKLILCARLQSRTYGKNGHERMINEISAYRYEKLAF